MEVSPGTTAFCVADYADFDMLDGQIVQGVEGDYVRLGTITPLLAPHPGLYIVTLELSIAPQNLTLGWTVSVGLSGDVMPGIASIAAPVRAGSYLWRHQCTWLAAAETPGAFEANVVADWDASSADTWNCSWQMQLMAWRQGVRYAP
jgi:hypothetical protein